MDDKTLDLSEGLAIGSGIHIDENTHIEAVRYPKGSDFMCLMSTLLTKGNPGPGRILTWLGVVARNPLKFLKSLNPFGFAKSSLILLVMQSIDSTMGLRLKRSWWPPFGKVLATEGGKIPTFIPQANSFAEKLSQELGGTPRTSLGEIFLNVPSTAHILGGAKMGADPDDGVIDYRCRVFNYKNMYVCDGSMIGANLGVNPSLTITALTEHAMSHIKPASETDWQDQAVPVSRGQGNLWPSIQAIGE
jgi:cholesterol oxidase